MYSNYKHQGIPLSEWQVAFHNLFTMGELYMMAKRGENFYRLTGFRPNLSAINVEGGVK